MKLSVLQEKIKKGLSITERVSSKSISLPILNNILISTEKNFLNLAATDLEVGINWWDLSKTEQEGRITVPAHVFSGFVGLLPNQKIDLSSEESALSIKCASYNTEIKGIPADEFPIIPKIDEGEFATVGAGQFAQNLSQVVDIASLSTTRPEISGVYLSFENSQITMVATDGFRLGEKKIFLKTNPGFSQNHSFIIPQRAAKEVINIFGEYNKDLKIYFSANQIMFEVKMDEADHPHIQLISRLIDGEYPNYKDIIPGKFATESVVDKRELANHLKTASFFSGKTNEVRVCADPAKKELVISSQSAAVGRHQSSVPAKIKGEPAEVAFNHRFLMDGSEP